MQIRLKQRFIFTFLDKSLWFICKYLLTVTSIYINIFTSEKNNILHNLEHLIHFIWCLSERPLFFFCEITIRIPFTCQKHIFKKTDKFILLLYQDQKKYIQYSDLLCYTISSWFYILALLVMKVSQAYNFIYLILSSGSRPLTVLCYRRSPTYLRWHLIHANFDLEWILFDISTYTHHYFWYFRLYIFIRHFPLNNFNNCYSHFWFENIRCVLCFCFSDAHTNFRESYEPYGLINKHMFQKV